MTSYGMQIGVTRRALQQWDDDPEYQAIVKARAVEMMQKQGADPATVTVSAPSWDEDRALHVIQVFGESAE